MELVILLVVVLGGIGWFIWSERQHDKSGTHPLDSVTTPSTSSTPITPTTTSVLDVNKDGKVDIKDAVAAVEIVKEEVNLDINKDGKVDIKDAVAAVEIVKEEVKTVAKKVTTKAKSTAKKATAKVETAVKKAKPASKPKK